MIENHQDHITNSIRTGDNYLPSKLPQRIREALHKKGWRENGLTSVVEAYSRKNETIFIQPSKTHRDRYAYVIDYLDDRPSKTAGVDGDTLIMDLT
jgi:hypothetical protein